MKSGWSEGGGGGRGKMEVLLSKMNISDHVV